MSFISTLMILAASGADQPGWTLSDFTFDGANGNRAPQILASSSVDYQPDNSDLIFFSSDGYKAYVSPYPPVNAYIKQYTLSTAYDLTTSTGAVTFGISSQVSFRANGLFFKPDGTEMYLSEGTNNKVHRYTLSTAWDLSTASFTESSVALGSEPEGIWFKSDGTKMYVADSSAAEIQEYDLSTAWSIGSSSLSNTNSPYDDGQGGLFRGVAFNADGTKVYRNNGSTVIYESSLSSAWDVSSATYTDSLNIGSYTPSSHTNTVFSNSGSKMYIASDRGMVDTYDLTSAYDVSTGSVTEPTTDYYNFGSNVLSRVRGLYIRNDGDYFFVFDIGISGFSSDNYIRRFAMSTPWDITTATLSQSVSGYGGEGLFFKPDGTEVYMVDEGDDKIYQYPLGTAWDLSTLGSSSSVTISPNYQSGLFFKSDGTSLYFLGDGVNQNRLLYRYNLSSAWDITTATYNSSKNLGYNTRIYDGLDFKPDGSRMYSCTGDGSFEVSRLQEWTLSSGFDISTATRSQEKNFGTIGSTFKSVRFRPNGQEAFVLNSQYPNAIAKLTFNES